MSIALEQHIQKLITIDDAGAAAISACFHHLSPRKKENLLQAGQACRYNYFVVKGCLRLFFINEKGVEQTTQFAIENWWLSDYHSFMFQQPATFFIQAVEKSEILAIDYYKQEQLFIQFPEMERYFRLVHQKAHAASQFRIKYLYDLSREEMYYHFTAHYPDFVQRIPQYLLASFLGFTPEYLSEIRAKKRS